MDEWVDYPEDADMLDTWEEFTEAETEHSRNVVPRGIAPAPTGFEFCVMQPLPFFSCASRRERAKVPKRRRNHGCPTNLEGRQLTIRIRDHQHPGHDLFTGFGIKTTELSKTVHQRQLINHLRTLGLPAMLLAHAEIEVC